MSSPVDSVRGPATATTLPVDAGIYTAQSLLRFPELLHGISTRRSPDGGDWNLSGRRGTPEHPPDPSVALSNRERLAARLGISLDSMVGCQQVHGSSVAVVDASHGGRGMRGASPGLQSADALVTATPGLYLLALSADCPPVFLYDPVRRVVGLAHSGWKGTVARIALNTVNTMSRSFGSDPADIVALVGPGIGPCCYVVGANVVEAVEEAFGGQRAMSEGTGSEAEALLEERGGQTYFNLWEAIKLALLDVGVRPENITVEGVCTGHNTDVFYSHRAEQGQCGLFGAVLGLVP